LTLYISIYLSAFALSLSVFHSPLYDTLNYTPVYYAVSIL